MKWHFRSTKFKVVMLSIFSTSLIYFFIMQPSPSSNPKLSLNYVVVHLDFKGAPPKLEYLESLLPIMSKHGVNALLIEYEDMFPYNRSLIGLRASNCYERAQLKNFMSLAVKFGFEIIPLIQTFGHMEFVLKFDEFKHLREDPQNPATICPSKNESLELIEEMLRQVIDFHSSISPLKHVHIGCDEVGSLKKCSDCKHRPDSSNGIFLKHVKAVENIVNRISQDTIVLVWDDMFRSIKEEWKTMEQFNNIEPVYWNYEAKVIVPHFALYQYHKYFQNIWIASAFKGADGNTAVLPNLVTRFKNHLDLMDNILGYKFGGEAVPFEFKGIILTGWSRYSHFDTMCELLPTSIPSLILNLIVIQKFKEGVFSKLYWWEYSTVFASDYSTALNCSNQKILKLINIDVSSCDFSGSSLYNSVRNFESIENKMKACLKLSSITSSIQLKSNVNKCEKNWNDTYNDVMRQGNNNVAQSMSELYDKIVIDEYIAEKTIIAYQMIMKFKGYINMATKDPFLKKKAINGFPL